MTQGYLDILLCSAANANVNIRYGTEDSDRLTESIYDDNQVRLK
jgi:hypothetical protein